MNMDSKSLSRFVDLMSNEILKMNARDIKFYTDNSYSTTEVSVFVGGCIHKYMVDWSEVRSLTEAAVPILVNIQMIIKTGCVEYVTRTVCQDSPVIKDVLFNPPATIVFWEDGTKTVVKNQGEKFDPEKGLAMAIAKKTYGNNGSYYNVFKKHVGEYNKKPLTFREIDRIVNNKATRVRTVKEPLEFDTEFLFSTRRDAERILNDMYKVANMYKFVTVADLYELAELKPPFRSDRCGWKLDQLKSAKIVRKTNGWGICLPKPSVNYYFV